MYCVRCGVRLQDGAESCPLCETPVWNPEQSRKEHSYPDHYPSTQKESGLPFAVSLTVICVMAITVILIVCLRLYGELRWGGYVLGGIALFYIVAVLPRWFRRPPIEVFIPVDHAAAALYVLFICLHTGGHWFMSFAFPVILAGCLLLTATACLLKHVRGARLIILGGFLLGLGGFTVLVEFFEHLTFGTPMFLWSLYSLAGFAVAGGFLLLSGLIPSMRASLEKRFFF